MTESKVLKEEEKEEFASNILFLNGVIESNERELRDPRPNYYRSDIYKYDFDPIEQQKSIDKQKQKLVLLLNQYRELTSEEELNKLKYEMTVEARMERWRKSDAESFCAGRITKEYMKSKGYIFSSSLWYKLVCKIIKNILDNAIRRAKANERDIVQKQDI